MEQLHQQHELRQHAPPYTAEKSPVHKFRFVHSLNRKEGKYECIPWDKVSSFTFWQIRIIRNNPIRLVDR